MIVETSLVVDDVTAFLPEAQEKFDALSKLFEKEQLMQIAQNMVSSNPLLAVAFGSIVEEVQLNEYIVKHVSAKGEVTKTQDRKTRERKAFQTTGLSKSARRQIARKAVKTKRANPSTQVRAERKRKRALKRRKMLGLS